MISAKFDYEGCVKASEKVAWKLDDVFPADRKLDFSKRFLPDAMTGIEALAFLSAGERLKLNQITGNAYLYLFYFVEEYIVASVVQHATGEMFGESGALRALLRFADEEVKHQLLFQRFGAAFVRDFEIEPGLIENPQAVAELILSKAPMAVLLTTLHLELVTQQHFADGYREGHSLDPQFASLLKHHWLDEAQHAKIDVLELQKLQADATPEMIESAVDEYLGILQAFGGLLAHQAELDAGSLEKAIGRTLSDAEKKALVESQTRAYRRMFIGYGLSNAMFLKYLEQFSPNGLERARAQAEALS